MKVKGTWLDVRRRIRLIREWDSNLRAGRATNEGCYGA